MTRTGTGPDAPLSPIRERWSVLQHLRKRADEVLTATAAALIGALIWCWVWVVWQ